MPRKDAFILTRIGLGEGRYEVNRADGASSALRQGRSEGGKVVKAASARSKATIKEITRTHAAGLKRLADR